MRRDVGKAVSRLWVGCSPRSADVSRTKQVVGSLHGNAVLFAGREGVLQQRTNCHVAVLRCGGHTNFQGPAIQIRGVIHLPMSEHTPKLNLPPGSVETSCEIGRGAFAVVQAGSLCGSDVVVKTPFALLHPDLYGTHAGTPAHARMVQEVFQEAELLQECFGVRWDGHAAIVTERADMSLDAFLARHVVDGTTLATVAVHVLRAVTYLHTRSVVHRDIKPANVLVVCEGDASRGMVRTVKLADLGLATRLRQSHKPSAAGTHFYMAPEMATMLHYDARVDVYSVGVMLAEVAAAHLMLPAPAEPPLPDAGTCRETVLRTAVARLRAVEWNTMADLIVGMTAAAAEERLSAADALHRATAVHNEVSSPRAPSPRRPPVAAPAPVPTSTADAGAGGPCSSRATDAASPHCADTDSALTARLVLMKSAVRAAVAARDDAIHTATAERAGHERRLAAQRRRCEQLHRELHRLRGQVAGQAAAGAGAARTAARELVAAKADGAAALADSEAALHCARVRVQTLKEAIRGLRAGCRSRRREVDVSRRRLLEREHEVAHLRQRVKCQDGRIAQLMAEASLCDRAHPTLMRLPSSGCALEPGSDDDDGDDLPDRVRLPPVRLA